MTNCSVGIRELKSRASELVRKVREERARYVVTYHGRPVGLLIPLDGAEDPPGPAGAEALDRLEELSQRVADGWQEEHGGSRLIEDMRR